LAKAIYFEAVLFKCRTLLQVLKNPKRLQVSKNASGKLKPTGACNNKPVNGVAHLDAYVFCLTGDVLFTDHV